MPNTRPASAEALDNLISQKVVTLPPSGIREFFDLLSSVEDVISLGIGEPDFVTPWHIREAGIYSLEQGYTMYTSNSGMPELRQELARYLEFHYGANYHPEHEILITAGSSEGLDLVLNKRKKRLCNQGYRYRSQDHREDKGHLNRLPSESYGCSHVQEGGRCYCGVV